MYLDICAAVILNHFNETRGTKRSLGQFTDDNKHHTTTIYLPQLQL